jgi:hypothetical protein
VIGADRRGRVARALRRALRQCHPTVRQGGEQQSHDRTGQNEPKPVDHAGQSSESAGSATETAPNRRFRRGRTVDTTPPQLDGIPPKVRFATDSSLEGAGFEPSVPQKDYAFARPCSLAAIGHVPRMYASLAPFGSTARRLEQRGVTGKPNCVCDHRRGDLSHPPMSCPRLQTDDLLTRRSRKIRQSFQR